MIQLSSLELEKAVKGEWVHDVAPVKSFDGISIDSRTIKPGSLFVAIAGKRFDGHRFLGQAFERGAAAAVVEQWPVKETLPAGAAVFQTADTLTALGAIARFHRDRFSFPVIAITGSCGKSTTKTILAHLLSGSKKILATPGTQNNRIGVPLTLFGLDASHQAVVLELGTNLWGEIKTLTEICRPTIGVVTMIGPSHLETFGDLEGVLKEKSAIWQMMDPDCPVVLNADDPLLLKAGRALKRPVIWYGFGPDAQIRAERVELGARESAALINGQWPLRLPLPGRHNLSNALAALAVALQLGEPMDKSVERLATVPAVPGRLNWLEKEGIFFLDDSYNANPASLKAGLDVLFQQQTRGRRGVVVGDMLELGAQSELLHRQMGREIAACGPDFLVGVGQASRWLLEAAWDAGLPKENGFWFESAQEAGRFVARQAKAGDQILIKGSRGMKMESILECCTISSTV